jgi:hypothetical protein
MLHQLQRAIPVTRELLAASSGFMGGTIFTGLTCSAFTAGVMALGFALGEIENGRLRVLRMIGTMAVGGDAFADKLNAFSRMMNLGHDLSQWFAAEFGSTQCRAITQCDFSTTEGGRRYVEGGGTARCSAIAQSVARRVRSMVAARGALGAGTQADPERSAAWSSALPEGCRSSHVKANPRCVLAVRGDPPQRPSMATWMMGTGDLYASRRRKSPRAACPEH